MNYPSIRIAVIGNEGGAPPRQNPYLVSGDANSWLPEWLRARLRPGRGEPLAACLSVRGETRDLDQLLHDVEGTFRSGGRYSVTSSLSRALLASHASLTEENQHSQPEDRHYAAGIIAAVRPNGVYVARSGPSLVVALRRGEITSRSTDRHGRSPQGATELGTMSAPHVVTEHYALNPGDALLLVPGNNGAMASERAIAGALDGLPHLVMAEALLDEALAQAAAIVVWCPIRDDEESPDPRWSVWTEAPRLVESPRDGRPPARVEPEPDVAPGPFTPLPPEMEDRTHRPQAESRPPTRRRNRAPAAASNAPGTPLGTQVANAARAVGMTGVLSVGLLALIALVVVLLVRAALPSPGGSPTALADAGRIIQEANANPDPEVAASLLEQAISILEPLIPSSEGARALSVEARSSQDRALDIVRIARPNRVALPPILDIRPAGLWKTASHLIILDLGGPALYRLPLQGDGFDVTLRPGEVVEGQPLGRFVTGAWSPPRGSNTDGRLMLIDHVRSIISVVDNGSPERRWWPPDNAEWQRLGAAAASFDDLYVLDTGREEIRRYPTRLAGAASTVVARNSEEVPLANVMDLATDGNLYVLLNHGGVLKLAPGSGRLPFDGTVPYRPLQVPAAMFAHPDLDHVWVLEPSAARVVELTNQGAYVRQFVLPPELMRSAVAIHVDGQSQVLRILTPQAILLVQLT